MKSLSKLLWLLGLCFCPVFVFAQRPSADLTLLAAPATPAATLLGISPTEVDKPRDPLQFLATLSNASDVFSGLPGRFAVEFAPAWMFRPSRITFDKFCSEKMSHSAWQGLTLSFATTGPTEKTDTTGLRQVAFALKTSLLRGKISKATRQNLAHVQGELDSLSMFLNDMDKRDATLALLDSLVKSREHFKDKALRARRDERRKFLNDSIVQAQSEWFETFGKDLAALRFTRVGWKLDLTAGMVVDFPGGQFDFSRTSRASAWLSGGYENEWGLSLLGLARWQTNPGQIYALNNAQLERADVQTFDAGGRLVFAPADSRFTLSSEGVYRSYFGPDVAPESNWKFTLNAEYRFHGNKSLTFSWGRDFGGVVTRKHNLIALLSLFTGFGSEKSTEGMEQVGKRMPQN